MKLKPKILKKKQKTKLKENLYPEENNPFSENQKKKKKKRRNTVIGEQTQLNGQVCKDNEKINRKQEKNNKEKKKLKKLRGKRERAISRVILEEEQGLIRVRKDTIVQQSIHELESSKSTEIKKQASKKLKSTKKNNGTVLSETNKNLKDNEKSKNMETEEWQQNVNKTQKNQEQSTTRLVERNAQSENSPSSHGMPLTTSVTVHVHNTLQTSQASALKQKRDSVSSENPKLILGDGGHFSSDQNKDIFQLTSRPDDFRKNSDLDKKIKPELNNAKCPLEPTTKKDNIRPHEQTKTNKHVAKNPFEDESEEEATLKNPEKSKVDKPKKSHGLKKIGRTSSVLISSRERKKKKRLKILKKFKKKKKKKEGEKPQEEQGNFVNPKPSSSQLKHSTAQLQQKVEEVKMVVNDRVTEGLVQRQHNLSELLKKSETLDNFAGTFAKTNRDIARKKKVQAGCCGIFAKYRWCWFLCTCERGLKLKKKKTKHEKSSSNSSIPISRAARADDCVDEDDAYERVQANTVSQSPPVRLRNSNYSNNKSFGGTQFRQSCGSKASTSSLLCQVQNKRFLQSIDRSSFPKADQRRFFKTKTFVKAGRKSSSLGELDKLVQMSPLLNMKAQQSIQENISYYDDEEKKKAFELLMLDYS